MRGEGGRVEGRGGERLGLPVAQSGAALTVAGDWGVQEASMGAGRSRYSGHEPSCNKKYNHIIYRGFSFKCTNFKDLENNPVCYTDQIK